MVTSKLSWWVALVAGAAIVLSPFEADAKRLGGGRPAGMQRSAAPDKPAQQTPAQQAPANQAAPNTPGAPANAAAPAAAGATAAAAASKRSWLGPIAGLAAGLGLAALFSHLGMGEGLANVVMLLLLALLAFVAIRFVMRRFAGGNANTQRSPLAMAGATAGAAASPVTRREASPTNTPPSVTIGSALPQAAQVPVAAQGPRLPADFDAEGFERLAKMLFIRMQAANDRADLNDLRQFTTPELFASLRLDLQERADAAQTTDVVKLDARLTDFAEEDGRQIVSVRYSGLVREQAGGSPEAFDEVWHLVKPRDSASGQWAIAGIQQHA